MQEGLFISCEDGSSCENRVHESGRLPEEKKLLNLHIFNLSPYHVHINKFYGRLPFEYMYMSGFILKQTGENMTFS